MARTLTPSEVQKLQAALSTEGKIEAIKLCREFTGLGLAEAKECVESLDAASPSSVGPAQVGDSTPVTAAIFSGNTIQAIKLYRAAHPGIGLAEAKEQIETMAADLYAKQPGQFSRPPRKAGCAPVLILGILLPAAVWHLVAR